MVDPLGLADRLRPGSARLAATVLQALGIEHLFAAGRGPSQ